MRFLLVLLTTGCFQSMAPPPTETGGGAWSIVDAIAYRDDLASHPGCTTDGLSYPAAQIPGYLCAAKQYVAADDPARPIVLLVHGNSDTPASWERFEDGAPMLAETLVAAGHRVYAVDFRIDRVDDPQTNNDTENAARNIDHGWATPIAAHFIDKVMDAHPDRRFAVVGFSLGATVIRDALRRLYVAGEDPFARLDDVVLLAGAHHGVSTFTKLCGKNPTMRGRVACELGRRDNFTMTDFLAPLNGPSGADGTPCADGDSAFGVAGACEHAVAYTTVVMRDIADGSYQDEFVSEASSALPGADNPLIELTDVDESGYFFGGLLKNHYGSARSAAAIAIVAEVVR